MLAAVAAGGAVGASLRYFFLGLFPGEPGRFPFTVFAENLLGAFLLGLVLSLLLERGGLEQTLRAFLTTGVLGSFTTFSNYSLDVVGLVVAARLDLALLYALGSVVTGLAAARLGMGLARAFAP